MWFHSRLCLQVLKVTELPQVKARQPLVLVEAGTFPLHLWGRAQKTPVDCGALCYGVARAVPNRS